MGIAVKPLCSTEILFLSLTEMKQRLLSLPVENVPVSYTHLTLPTIA